MTMMKWKQFLVIMIILRYGFDSSTAYNVWYLQQFSHRMFIGWWFILYSVVHQ